MNTLYRIYPDGTVLHQDDFGERDCQQPYVDDYATFVVPDEIVAHIEDMVLGN